MRTCVLHITKANNYFSDSNNEINIFDTNQVGGGGGM